MPTDRPAPFQFQEVGGWQTRILVKGFTVISAQLNHLISLAETKADRDAPSCSIDWDDDSCCCSIDWDHRCPVHGPDYDSQEDL